MIGARLQKEACLLRKQTRHPPRFFFIFVVYYLNLYARHTHKQRGACLDWENFPRQPNTTFPPFYFSNAPNRIRRKLFPLCLSYTPAASVCEKHETTTSWQDRLLLRLYTWADYIYLFTQRGICRCQRNKSSFSILLQDECTGSCQFCDILAWGLAFILHWFIIDESFLKKGLDLDRFMGVVQVWPIKLVHWRIIQIGQPGLGRRNSV